MVPALFICGMPGSGKSTIGKKLSVALKWKFYDLDKVVFQLHGLSAASLIREKGEEYFRNIESETLRGLDLSEPCIISSGGGTPCFNGNLDWMKEKGHCLFINLPLKALESRVKQSKEFESRPLISDRNQPVIEVIEELWNVREPYFSTILWWEDGLTLKLDELKRKVLQKFEIQS